MENYCRSREKLEGWQGRHRTYFCTECSKPIHVDTLKPLPKIDRVCPECKKWTEVYTFVNKHSHKEHPVRAHGAELATLRAWKISPNLTFKISEVINKP